MENVDFPVYCLEKAQGFIFDAIKSIKANDEMSVKAYLSYRGLDHILVKMSELDVVYRASKEVTQDELTRHVFESPAYGIDLKL